MVTPDIRENIKKPKRIFTSLESHFVYDIFYDTQSFACQGYGHKQGSEHCTTNDNESVCLYCTGNHRSKDSRYKQDLSKYKCANCLRSKNPAITSSANGHTATNNECLVWKRETNLPRQNTCNKMGNSPQTPRQL